MYYRSECAAQDFAPAHRINLEEMPSTFISCSEADPCRDELIMYASRLLRSYVSTELHVIAATFHGFDSVMPAFDGSKRLRLLHADTLARAFAY
ncbi:hypothetical protein A5662_11955 [Mycobacteriaceae bacterium 1482268.1]|nr:hypothetical protein A5662_11955 [Mycobacteriaceae bacterium 1482268.1]